MDRAGSMYGNNETDQFMIDVTSVIYGHAYDPNEAHFSDGHGDQNSPYFAGFGVFDLTYQREANDRDVGWKSKYDDDSGNQAYHFWFYVATAYFDGKTRASGGNFLHDGYSTGLGKLYKGAEPTIWKIDEATLEI